MFILDPASQIPDPDFYPSRISDPKTEKKRGVKKICCHTFFCSHKFHKIVNCLTFEMLKIKIWANFQRIIELFTQKIVTKLSKIWVCDPGSEIRDPKNTYSGFRIQGSKRHRIPDPDPQHWQQYLAMLFKCCLMPWNNETFFTAVLHISGVT